MNLHVWPILPFLIATLLIGAANPKSKTLRSAADRKNLLVGAAVRPSLFIETDYSETLGREFNMVEPEDAMKWEVIRRNPGTFNFHDGDAVVQFAQAHGMKIRGHCLVWDHNNPEWLTSGNFTPRELSTLLREHIATVMRHYAGQVFAWDVVNEALDESGRLKDSPWYNRPGIDTAATDAGYIIQAFRWAREADPHALLFYNEAEGEALNRKSDAIYSMVKEFKRRGVPIDGVGLQMHIPDLQFDAASVAANIARLTALGLQVHITELDVAVPVSASGQALDADLRRQAGIYGAVAQVCLQNPGCTAIQTWGLTDKYSWIGRHSRGTHGAALLFDSRYRPKESYDAMFQGLSADRNPRQ